MGKCASHSCVVASKGSCIAHCNIQYAYMMKIKIEQMKKTKTITINKNKPLFTW